MNKQAAKSQKLSSVEPGHFLFISYSHRDSKAIEEMKGILDRNSYAYWYDQGIESGKAWMEEISSKIRECAQFVLLLSDAAQNSENVNDEIYVAKQNKKPFVIVYLEETNLFSGIDLMIGRMQGIIRSKFAELSEFERRICADLSPDAKKDHAKAVVENKMKLRSVLSNLENDYEIILPISAKKHSRTFAGKSRRTGLSVFIKQFIFATDDTDTTLRYKSEKNALSLCRDPRLPYLIDCYEGDAGAFLVESFVPGMRLSKKNEISALEVIQIGIQLVRAAACLHRNLIVHGDIKPDNIIVSYEGDVYLLDFDTSHNVWESGVQWVRGTANFAAPELYNRDYQPDYRTDFYGIGRTLESLLDPEQKKEDVAEGEAGFMEDSPSSCEGDTVILWGLDPEPEERGLKNLHPQIQKLLDHMTAAKPEDRPADCSELLKEMEKCRLRLEFEALLK